MGRWFKWIGWSTAALVLLALASLAAATLLTRLHGEQRTPGRPSPEHFGLCADARWRGDRRQRESAAGLAAKPASSRPDAHDVFWRGPQIGWELRLMVALHRLSPSNLVDLQRRYFNQRVFAVFLVDARGSGASAGRRVVEYVPAEVADLGKVAAWSARLPWSNGRVGAFAVSYDGNDAELAALPNQPAIRAVMPLYDTALTEQRGGPYAPIPFELRLSSCL